MSTPHKMVNRGKKKKPENIKQPEKRRREEQPYHTSMFWSARYPKLINHDDEWWEQLLNLEIIDGEEKGSDCSKHASPVASCAPEKLKTKDGTPYICLPGSVGDGAVGEVMIYNRNHNGKNQEIVVKLMNETYDRCEDTFAYYYLSNQQSWCPYVVVQRCIGRYICSRTSEKVKVLALEKMDMTFEKIDIDKFYRGVQLVFLQKIHTAMLCIWNYGGVYTDMKPANVMMNLDRDIPASLVKLVDLESINEKGSNNGVCTFPPPQNWNMFISDKERNPASTKCNEETLIWQFAIAVLFIIGGKAWSKFWQYLVWDYTQQRDTPEKANDLMDYIREIFFSSNPTKPYKNVYKCFAKFENDNDWRIDQNVSPPFTFKDMFTFG